MAPAGYDVIVLGLGAMGSAAARSLAGRGRRVLGFDRHHPPHRFGSSHGRSRAIRKAYFEHPDYVPLLHHAYDAWQRLEQDSGRTLLRRTGTLMMGTEHSPVVCGSLRAARDHGLGHELLDATELERRFPALRPHRGTVGVFEEVGGVLAPEACIEAQLDLAARDGAELRLDEAVLAWTPRPEGGVQVRTSSGSYEAERLILAAGAWSPQLLASSAIRLQVSRQVLFWLNPTGSRHLFSPPRLPVWVWSLEDGPTFYGFPALDGLDQGLKVGIHTAGESCDADSVNREVRPSDLEQLRLCLEHRVRDLAPEPFRACVCLYTNTPDGHFVLGAHPEHPAVLLAAGFSGHGFKFAALFGEVLAQLATDGETDLPIGIFHPQRFLHLASG